MLPFTTSLPRSVAAGTVAVSALLGACGAQPADIGSGKAASAEGSPESTTPPATDPSPSTVPPASTSAPTTSSEPRVSFGEMSGDADQVLGPLEGGDDVRFAILGHVGEGGALGDGSVELIVESDHDGWQSHHTVTTEGMPSAIRAVPDLDGDGLDEVQVDWFVGANTDFGTVYRIDADHSKLVEIPFSTQGLHEPMSDYTIESIRSGSVTTNVESCDPDCATGGSHVVTWNYDHATDELVVASQPDPEPVDPWLVAPGTIEDGTHYGYLVDQGDGWFSFDRADVAGDGSWSNTNPKVRNLPFEAYLPLDNGTPVQVRVANQHVTDVTATTPVVAPTDPYLIPPGTIEDGTHYGYLIDQGNGWFSFDRADVAADGSWTNTNPKARVIPLADYFRIPNGTPIAIVVTNQRLVDAWVM